jgi:hypothetical protein
MVLEKAGDLYVTYIQARVGLIEDDPYNILRPAVNKRYLSHRLSLAERCNKSRRQ